MALVPAGLSRLCPGSSFGLRQKGVVPALVPKSSPSSLKLRPSMVERLYSTMFPMWSCQSGHKWAIFFPKLRGRLREGYAMAMRQWNSARGYARATRAAEVGYAVPARCYKRLRVSQVRRFCERKWAFVLWCAVYIYIEIMIWMRNIVVIHIFALHHKSYMYKWSRVPDHGPPNSMGHRGSRCKGTRDCYT